MTSKIKIKRRRVQPNRTYITRGMAEGLVMECTALRRQNHELRRIAARVDKAMSREGWEDGETLAEVSRLVSMSIDQPPPPSASQYERDRVNRIKEILLLRDAVSRLLRVKFANDREDPELHAALERCRAALLGNKK